MVCREWRLACWDSLFWKDEETLDFTNLKTLLRLASHPFHRSSDYPRRLLRGLKCVMNPPALDLTQRCLTTTTIIFPSDMYFGGNYELTRVARRSPNLKRLMLPDAYNLEKSLTVALKMWKDLMEFINWSS
ncbi:hypothetical protein TorRG33x02_179230 [Trema orientale]|uniref:F-box domain containing protein n=1 Tax=Trema orientale TaxID=63057 RepID=A0A2P5ELB5_TREOI|nr:hypothetical protein TorRG33x02_179230 [Trema orientale]